MHTSTTSTGQLQPWSATDLAIATAGTWFQDQLPQVPIARILTDSRQASHGDAFLALKGERFDAHQFLMQVEAQGATCAIVSQIQPELSIPQLVVADTRLALGHLGAYRRQQCTDLKVVALTGSSGKTTTKEMLGSIFSRLGTTLVTRGNLNNDLGVPMMLLELRQDHQFAVIELGANHQGEIDYTSNLVCPDVAGIINIGTAHLGEFGGREGICTAKSEIYAHIQAQGTAIVPAHDDFTAHISTAAQAYPILKFGQGGDVYAIQVELDAQSSQFDLVTPKGTIHIHLPFAGMHNVYNAEAAASFALALDVPLDVIAAGLAEAKGAKGRLNFLQKGQYLLIDDTYNANPNSMCAAADVLTQQHGIKVMVMGDIGELGDAAPQAHFELGQALGKKALNYILAVGEYASAVKQGANVEHAFAFATQQEAHLALRDLINTHQQEQMAFLFKGSRSAHMENVLALLMENL